MEMLTMRDVAGLLGVTLSTVYNLRHRHQLPDPDFYPSPRVLLWKRETIDAWVATRNTGTNGDKK